MPTKHTYFSLMDRQGRNLVNESNEQSLRDYLCKLLGDESAFVVEAHHGGHSNETYFLEWGNRELVLKGTPLDKKTEDAHDVGREFRIMEALEGTDVPVPNLLSFCDDPEVIGAEFILMDRIHGDVLHDEPKRFASPDRRATIAEETIEAMAHIHTTDYRELGLGELGNPEGYKERQIETWSKQLDWAFSKTGREVDELLAMKSWLRENTRPAPTTSLVHGDYRLGNIMFGEQSDPKIEAVLDWELSTIGDPLIDLGWLLLMWQEPDDPECAIPEWMSPFTSRDGYPKREGLVESYEAKSDIQVENLLYYETLAAFKLAASGELVWARYLEGSLEGDLPPRMEEYVPKLAKQAMGMIQ